MTKTDLATFRELLRAKQIELSAKSLERIAIERSADELEVADRGDEGVLESIQSTFLDAA
jgi:hypothetical protein